MSQPPHTGDNRESRRVRWTPRLPEAGVGSADCQRSADRAILVGMSFIALFVFGLILAVGRVSKLGRRLLSGFACLVGATLALVAAAEGDAFTTMLAGASLMSAGSAGLLCGAVPPRVAIGFLALIGLPWVLVLWMGIRLSMADTAVPGADGALWIPAGVLILYAALVTEELAERRTHGSRQRTHG